MRFMRIKPIYLFLFAVALMVITAATGSKTLLVILIVLMILGRFVLPLQLVVWLFKKITHLARRFHTPQSENLR